MPHRVRRCSTEPPVVYQSCRMTNIPHTKNIIGYDCSMGCRRSVGEAAAIRRPAARPRDIPTGRRRGERGRNAIAATQPASLTSKEVLGEFLKYTSRFIDFHFRGGV